MRKALILTFVLSLLLFTGSYLWISTELKVRADKKNTLALSGQKTTQASKYTYQPRPNKYVNKTIPNNKETITTPANTQSLDSKLTTNQTVELRSPEDQKQSTESNYPLHDDITSTIFWAGEVSSIDNDFITNTTSAWDEFWQEHFGGYDDPVNRNGYFPAGFRPKENPFYVALPYNDFDENGNRRDNSNKVIYWAKDKEWTDQESIVKNHWVKIIHDDKTAYAQWEDSGPFVYDDSDYVFGDSRPKNTQNNNAAIDVSPAVRDYLELKEMDKVSWIFIDEKDVPAGPWKEITTTSQLSF